ncbi:protein of unknown function [Taphrina deformans PYCC 5710]|uniref:WLM domain-containing protein n=1 Tax=Taphrina deformans (strain PYCC 5710 / ATCC 11124 / CBS 356.35 / IMI 108563 / JCM 9778 / NBRC 8474) TaxID=1097556 RepID=R4XGQ2_TAPDE|nr:protein of unknown function [Taphrina deformans PYCC 5710]|eukprot:CCG84976.1 protein of unknown function [Taphrina deformans PYCC 5710]
MVHTRVERFNDHGRHPNKFISFIKEDRRTTTKEDQQRALGVLNRVAAIVYPIMKDNGLQVTTLEEHPYNDSYAGINYDAGDCIGLVLRTARGNWVPESYVLSVMLHELSHCTNMHHASTFWKTLGVYRSRMAQLRTQSYTGEGFWSKGIALGSEETGSLATAAGDLPKALCGGAFKGSPFLRRRRKKGIATKRAKKLKTGEKLGGDLEIRKSLDGGKSKATPRVVKSKRGQELRAKAAELRFSQQLTEQAMKLCKDDSDEFEDLKEFKPDWKTEDEDSATQKLLAQEMQQETGKLKQSTIKFEPRQASESGKAIVLDSGQTDNVTPEIKIEPVSVDIEDPTDNDTTDEELPAGLFQNSGGPQTVDGESSVPDGVACHICTLSSEPSAIFCDGCGTLKRKSEQSWSCKSLDCQSVQYLNHVDSIICGLCGCRRM